MKPQSQRHCFSVFLAILVILACPCRGDDWLVKDAPFRAKVRLSTPSTDPDAGVAIVLPDFGLERMDLGDALLIDATGLPVPMNAIWHGGGQRGVFLAKGIDAAKDYFLYFGGQIHRPGNGWTPKEGLTLETRQLSSSPKIGNWTEMQNTWKEAIKVDGIGFVDCIYVPGNPFGAETNFASHYSGWLKTPTGGDVTLYTLSSDASFILINGHPVLEWPGLHGPVANKTTVHMATVPGSSELLKVDYYQAKVGDPGGVSVLGWQRDGKFETVPPSAWVRPGKSSISEIQSREGWPIPVVSIHCDSYIGFADKWLYAVSLESKYLLPEGWSLELSLIHI